MKNSIYMDIANKYAAQSKDPRLKVGCIIVTSEGIVYPGYNGDEIGGDNIPDSMDPGKSGFVHAEANAILKFNPTIHKNCSIYITSSPCVVCARMIINTKSINYVYYKDLYRDSLGLNLLAKSGISTTQI